MQLFSGLQANMEQSNQNSLDVKTGSGTQDEPGKVVLGKTINMLTDGLL